MRRFVPFPALLFALSALLTPAVAIAGGGPIFTIGDWGVGECDNRFTLHLGKDRFVDTPIPTPPEGPRWEVAYDALPYLAGSACAAATLWLRRGRRRSISGFEVRPLQQRPLPERTPPCSCSTAR
jgi:hypothetical protein